jgi:hypothetical protein
VVVDCREQLQQDARDCWSARFSRVWLDLAARAEILSLQLRIMRSGDGQGHKENDREEIVCGQSVVQSYGRTGGGAVC